MRLYKLCFIAVVLTVYSCGNKSTNNQQVHSDTSIFNNQLPNTANTQGHKSDSCAGTLGDVKYSVLKLKDFQDRNGDCWVTMGQISKTELKNTKLGYLVDTIPDARGVFIRGINEGQTHEKGDPEDREIGSIQPDMVGPHKHPLADNIFVEAKHYLSGNGPGGIFLFKIYPPETKENAGIETRPRNICLYAYIRVN